MKLAAWAADLVGLLLPRGCVACGDWIPSGTRDPFTCARCRSRLAEPPWPRCPRCHHPRGTGKHAAAACLECDGWPAELTWARAAFIHASPASDLVHGLKYEGWPELARPMAASMARLELPAVPEGARRLIVPMPTTPARLRERGYNQAALLAGGVSEALDRPVCEALARRRGGASQTSLAPLERRANVRGAFVATPAGARRVAGAHVLLVDDVLTTGATASEAACTLSRAGAATVTALAFARALPGRP